MDWRVYHRINVFVSHHHGVGQVFRYVESYGTVVIAVAAVLLWLLARPDADPKWKLAAASALASGALAFLVNQVIHALWDRARPYEAHAGVYHPYSTSTDAGFPSDHSSAAFGIAVAVVRLARPVLAFLVRLVERLTDPIVRPAWRYFSTGSSR